jgi:hypothetical protein
MATKLPAPIVEKDEEDRLVKSYVKTGQTTKLRDYLTKAKNAVVSHQASEHL